MKQPKRRPLPARIRCVAVVGLIAGLVGCTQVPELDTATPEILETADYPALIPLGPEFKTANAPQSQSEELEKELEARRNRLAARARRLDAPILDSAARARMQAEIALPEDGT